MRLSIRACKYCLINCCTIRSCLKSEIRQLKLDIYVGGRDVNNTLIYRCKKCVPLASVGDKIRYSLTIGMKKEYEGKVLKVLWLKEKPVYYQVEVFGDKIYEIQNAMLRDHSLEPINEKYYLYVKYNCMEVK